LYNILSRCRFRCRFNSKHFISASPKRQTN